MNKRTRIAELTANRAEVTSYQEARLILALDQSDKGTTALAKDFFTPGEPRVIYNKYERRRVWINKPEDEPVEWTEDDKSVSELALQKWAEDETRLDIQVDDDNAELYVVVISAGEYGDQWSENLGLVKSLEEARDLVEKFESTGYRYHTVEYMYLDSRRKSVLACVEQAHRTMRNALSI